MHIEYEVRILEIDEDQIKKKLDEIAKFEWNQLQRRYVYDFIPKEKNGLDLEQTEIKQL